MSNTANGEELRQIIEQWETAEAAKKSQSDHQKDIMAMAKGRGYDTAVIKALIAQRKKDPNDVAEFEAVMEMYQAAMGGA